MGAIVHPLLAQPILQDTEPNDTPAEAQRFSGEVNVVGSLPGDDQDGYFWTVADVDAEVRWHLELEGIPGHPTAVEVVRVEFADDGVGVTDRENVAALRSRDGTRPGRLAGVLFEPGEYLLGVAKASGEGPYRLRVRRGERIPGGYGSSRFGSRDEARRIGGRFATSSYLETAEAWWRWELSEDDAGKRWEIVGGVPVGRRATLSLHDGEGRRLAEVESDAEGRLRLPDLALEAGSYFLLLRRRGEAGMLGWLASEPRGARVAGREEEPNDLWERANAADLRQPLAGRVAPAGDADHFRVRLGDEGVGERLDLRLTAPAGVRFTLCLRDEEGQNMQCRVGVGGVALRDLELPPGDYGIWVGRGPEGAEYALRLQPADPSGRDPEPNDRPDLAVGVEGRTIKGRFTGEAESDTDVFRFVVEGEAQLWRLQTIGDGVQQLAHHDGSGQQAASVRPSAGERRTRLSNLFLLPGTHYAAVTGTEGDYVLRVLPIGPPDPRFEREPNDDVSRAHALPIGGERIGLLEQKEDWDRYRFSLAAPERVRLTIAPPPDGALEARLFWEGSTVRSAAFEPGEQAVFEGLLPPGDWDLALLAHEPSDGEYRVALERLDRFGCPVDCEPNDPEPWAAPLPPHRVLEGSVGTWRDVDWYEIPAGDTERTLRTPGSEGVNLWLQTASGETISLERSEEGFTAALPAGEPVRLRLDGRGEYRLPLELAPAPPAGPPPSPLPAALEVELESEEVAAYRRLGQRLGGRVRFVNRGETDLTVTLEAAVSDPRWRVVWTEGSGAAAGPHRPAAAGSPPVASAPVDVPGGSAAGVPFLVEVPADAWADEPVRLSFRAVDAESRWASAWGSVVPRTEARPVNPRRAWEVPTELRGGLDVAWSGLGGSLVGAEPAADCRQADQLFDQLARLGAGIDCSGRGSVTVTVELAGDRPVPVAGFLLDPQSGKAVSRSLRRYALDLSVDGEAWREVAAGALAPLPVEQPVVLEDPVPARFARLRMLDSHGHSRPRLGEWKVVATPGSAPLGELDLAALERGGHVVWSDPPIGTAWGREILSAAAERPWVSIPPKGRAEWVLGFHHDRAAQITRLEWVPSAQDRFPALEEVAVAVSLESPLGPWRPLGSWGVSGTRPAPFRLPEPVWARFVKLSAPGEGGVALPETLRVFERAADDSYRSILGEWGRRSGAGPFEASRPLPAEVVAETFGNRSRATAQLLPAGRPVRGRVRLGGPEAWYGFVVPAGHNTLEIVLTGAGSVGGVRVVTRLEDAEGQKVPLREVETPPRRHVLEAVVEPGGTYFLAVAEPPRSVIFSWDTSASVQPFLPVIYNSVAGFVADVTPGREEVNLLPFGADLLLERWSGHPWVLSTALNEYARDDRSSEAEETLARAAKALSERAGTRAIVVITDAVTNNHPEVWRAFSEVRPRVFVLGVAGDKIVLAGPAGVEDDLMEDWSRVDAGHYTYLTTQGEMERGFARAVALLRRPADFTLEIASRFEEAPGPGRLLLVDAEASAEGGGPAVELVLDASGSMLQRMEDGRRRIVVAREVLRRVVGEQLPPGTPLALRVFGHRTPNACRTDLVVPLAPLEPERVDEVLAGIEAKNLAKTPIADSLAAVEQDLAGASGPRLVVLVTDGEETCDGDPEAVLARLREKGFDVSVNVVGFAIDDPELERTFAGWAAAGGGRYFSARDDEGLDEAMRRALETPFTVYDPSGTAVAEGLVDGEPVPLEAGVYRVEVATAPPTVFPEVEVPGEEEVVLEVGAGP